MKSLTLFELQHFIKKVIVLNFDQEIQVVSELAKVNISRGHTYLELVEKSKTTDQIIAKAQGVLWKNKRTKLLKQHGHLLNDLLVEGVEVSLTLKIEYHEVYGLKLHVVDIDPNYTIGAFAAKRSKILEELKAKNLIEKNKTLILPSVIQKVAVISSASAAGWADFSSSLDHNPYNFKFQFDLFPASMQGNNVEAEVCQKLQEINEQSHKYDIIVIVRGGGSKIDLSYFDNRLIAEAIAGSHLPVFAGIGHEIDESVTEIVSHSSFKTPTAVAEAIIAHNLQFLSFLVEFKNRFHRSTEILFQREQSAIKQYDIHLMYQSNKIIEEELNFISNHKKSLLFTLQKVLSQSTHDLERIKDRFKYVNPLEVLSKGYAIIEQEGQRLKSIRQWKRNEPFNLQLIDGKIRIFDYESE